MSPASQTPNADFLIETSWEVANMVGGIHTVLASKAEAMRRFYGDNYVVIGPRLPRDGGGQDSFVPSDTMPGLAALLAQHGLVVETGRWNVPGEPRCLLVDFSQAYKDKNAILEWLWANFGVDSLLGGWDYLEPVLFAYNAGRVIEILAREQVLPFHRHVVAQWHEWLAAAGMLHLRRALPQVASVFTTHATILGRAVWGSGGNLETVLKEQTTVDCARSLNVLPKHSLEEAAVRECDCFTTVSQLTADEATLIFKRKPDQLLPNGLGDEFPPPLYRDTDSVATSRYSLLHLAELVTGRALDRRKTVLLMSAGRYEYLNKGINVVVDALGGLRDKLAGADIRVVCFLFFPAAITGPDRELLNARREEALPSTSRVCTHELHDEINDPIMAHLQKLGLNNSAQDRVQVVFAPIYLNGRDPIIKGSFYELLPAFDLTLFPSQYEPWGYTPLESISYGVPTVTTDVAGFGKWAQSVAPSQAVYVLPRKDASHEECRDSLIRYLAEFVTLDRTRIGELKSEARRFAAQANWRQFALCYRQAHALALQARDKRMPLQASAAVVRSGPPATSFFASVDGSPRLRPFTVKNSLPPVFAKLREFARNLWWTWHEEAEQLFAELSPEHWEASHHNPIGMLEMLPQTLLQRAARDEAYCARIARMTSRLDAYMAERRESAANPHIAYFCMEYGLHECLPLYSGGLGVLAGDHLKAASDLKLPLVAVGPAWRNGYFVQRIDHHGNQTEETREVDFAASGLEPVRGDDGSRVIIYVRIPGRSVAVQAWKAQVGSVPLYLLDTDLPINRAADREIASSLYRGDTERRLQQEMVLGIGGRKLLVALGYRLQVYHMNEGHAALVIFNRLVALVRDHDLDYRAALEYVRQTSVFTTHTPVPAGHDSFPEDLLRPYLSIYEDLLHKSWERLMALGRARPDNATEPFSMTLLALHGSAEVNAVSKTHRRVTQQMFQRAMPGFHVSEIPIAAVTNGAHARTWMAPAIRLLVDRELGEGWENRPVREVDWRALQRIGSAELAAARQGLKRDLLNRVRARLEADFSRRHDSPQLLARMVDGLDERSLVVGFARRFVSYKRPTLLLRELETLKRIVSQADRPVLFLFAGKAHPDDQWGKRLLQEVFMASRRDEFAGRLLLLEDYDLHLSRYLVRGCDVWLNTPIHLMEASGTSGMKAAMNGALNLSVLDGWWAEGSNGKNGWAIGAPPAQFLGHLAREQHTTDVAEEADSRHLYMLLERVLLPMFHAEGPARPSAEWFERCRESMIEALSRFSCTRMLTEYSQNHYGPALKRALAAHGDDFAAIRGLCAAKRRLAGAFSAVEIIDSRVSGLEDGELALGETVEMSLRLNQAGIPANELRVEFVAAPRDSGGEAERLVPFPLNYTGNDERGYGLWEGSFCPSHSGPHAWGVRVLPAVGADLRASSGFDFAFVKWL
ncbi:MAG: alpha-glucan family phosphorylase [Planctomycetes bacterium]|nr:alpha-glucan family phosphorylase [Planctomycetota bacterium]